MNRAFICFLSVLVIWACDKTPDDVSDYVPVQSVKLSTEKMSLVEGGSTNLTATVLPKNATNKTLSWSTSAPEVAIVEDGKVTAIHEGKAVISAKAEEVAATCLVIVDKKPIPVSSIELNESNIVLNKGEDTTLVATVFPEEATDKSIFWISSNSNIASVNQLGKVSAKDVGSVIVSANKGELKARCIVTVIIPVSSFEIDCSKIILLAGDSRQIGVIIKPDDATERTVSWESSNDAVATVTPEGLITAIAPGTASIMATCGGIDASCQVEVINDIPQDEIWYTTRNSSILKPYDSRAFLASDGIPTIVSNTYEDGIGIIHFSSPLKMIKSSAFRYAGVYSVITPSGITLIDDHAFYNSGIAKIIILGGRIGGSIFYNCQRLAYVKLSKETTSIPSDAFGYCIALKSLIIPETVSKIGYRAFYCCGIQTITLPEGITDISGEAFYRSGLEEVIVLSPNPPKGGPQMFNRKCMIYVPAESLEKYKVAPYWSDYADRIVAIESHSTN